MENDCICHGTRQCSPARTVYALNCTVFASNIQNYGRVRSSYFQCAPAHMYGVQFYFVIIVTVIFMAFTITGMDYCETWFYGAFFCSFSFEISQIMRHEIHYDAICSISFRLIHFNSIAIPS